MNEWTKNNEEKKTLAKKMIRGMNVWPLATVLLNTSQQREVDFFPIYPLIH